jgi:argininosuccinate synthase
MPEEALAAAKRYFELIGRLEIHDALDRGFAEAGYPGAMQLAADTLVESSESYGSPTQIAQLYAHAGLSDLTLEWLERAVADRDTHIVYTTVNPIYAYIWTDPRFQDLRRRINLSAIGVRPAAAVS